MLITTKWLSVVLSGLVLGTLPVAAQDYKLEKGEGEVTGFAGLADGEGTFGGAFGKAISDKLFVLGEFSYIAGGSGSSSTSAGTFKASAHALNFNGGVHYNFTDLFKNSPKFVPYAGAGLGITRVSASSSGPGFSASASDSSLFLNFGGGLRYYAKPNWGVRPELMVFAGDGSYVRFSVGLFYQF